MLLLLHLSVLQLSFCGFRYCPKRAISKRAISKRAPRATGVFVKMASRSCVSGCGRFLASSDGHGRCLSCLGYQHAESALVDESCSQGVPGTGEPETLGPALQEMVSPLLPPVEGRVGNPFFPFWVVPPLALRPVVPKLSEQFSMSPVPKGARTAVHGTQSPHSRPPLLLPVGSRVRFEDAMPSPVPPAHPWSQVSVAPRTQTLLRNALPSESGPCAPLRCPTAGTSVASLVPLVQSLGAWLALPRPSRWLMRTIRLGYAIQFARRPPKFRGVRFTSVLSKHAPLLRAEVAVLLAKDAIEPVPPAEMKSGFYSPYFIVPKKGGGLRPILDLRVLNRALHKLPFRMLTQRRIFQCIRPFDWFAAIDLKDAYFQD